MFHHLRSGNLNYSSTFDIGYRLLFSFEKIWPLALYTRWSITFSKFFDFFYKKLILNGKKPIWYINRLIICKKNCSSIPITLSLLKIGPKKIIQLNINDMVVQLGKQKIFTWIYIFNFKKYWFSIQWVRLHANPQVGIFKYIIRWLLKNGTRKAH
jgi:hypothetical protein